MFWFLSALCGGLTFASVVAHASTIDAHIFGFAATRYSVVLAMAFLTFWEGIRIAKKVYLYRSMSDIELHGELTCRSDGKPRYVGVEDAKVTNLSPEPYGSFASKATFHW